MTAENDLAPVPAGFKARNDASQVAKDSEALQRLGYLAPDACFDPTDPTDVTLRRAVLAFQLATGLASDGLLGPATRGELARVLREVGPPVTSGFDYPGIGDATAPPAVKLTGRLSSEFLRAVVEMTERMRARGATVTAEDFLKVWNAESGIDAHRPNGQGAPFGGLNQMGPTERKAAGFLGTFADFLALDELAQLPYVERYYDNAIKGGAGGNYGVLSDAASLYLVNFAPAFVSHAGEPDHVLFRRAANGPAPTAPEAEWAAWREAHKGDAYAWNRAFDRRKDGTIRVGDLRVVVEAAAGGSRAPFMAELRARLDAIEGTATPASGVAMLAGLLVLGGMLAGTYLAVRS